MAFRRRCRYDVLQAAFDYINRPGSDSCFKGVIGCQTHTRKYSREDLAAAVQYWDHRGFLKLLNRGLWIQIAVNHDEEIQFALKSYSWEEEAPTVSQSGAESDANYLYDFFVCHASEDKAAVVIPLVNALAIPPVRVWVDYREMLLGDSLRQRIDDGLSKSRFGIVVLSPDFFRKPWPQAELDALVSLELADKRKRILPVWHSIDRAGVAAASPLLAGRIGAPWERGIEYVVGEIRKAAKI